MDDSKRHQVAMGIGIALGLASIFIPSMIPTFPPVIAYAGLLTAAAFLLWGVWPLWSARTSGRKAKLISLAEAARLAFEAIEGSLMEAAAVDERFAPKGPVRFMATKLVIGGGVDLYGKQLPSTMSRKLPDDIFFAHELSADAKTLVKDGTSETTHVDLMVERSAVDAAIAALKTQHQPHPI